MIHLGITNDFIALPLSKNLTSLLENSEFVIKQQSLKDNYNDLINKKLDAAFISPADYAKDSSLLKLVKDVAIYSKGESRYSVLFFQEDLSKISEITFQSVTDYNDLTSLVFNEFFEMNPSWKPTKGKESINNLLNSYQAVLLSGEKALENFSETKNKLDITDQWWDKTGLSFVHQVIALRRDLADLDWIEQIYRSLNMGIKSLKQISKNYSDYHKHDPEFYLDLMTNIYHYTADETVWQDCSEYLEYLFYYGKIRFIPQFHFV